MRSRAVAVMLHSEIMKRALQTRLPMCRLCVRGRAPGAGTPNTEDPLGHCQPCAATAGAAPRLRRRWRPPQAAAAPALGVLGRDLPSGRWGALSLELVWCSCVCGVDLPICRQAPPSRSRKGTLSFCSSQVRMLVAAILCSTPAPSRMCRRSNHPPNSAALKVVTVFLQLADALLTAN